MIRANTIRFSFGASLLGAFFSPLSPASAQAPSSEWQARVDRHAAANGIPASLVHRVIMRESRYRPSLVGSGGAMGLMQIKLPTARSMGYTGTAAGLLDPETNMTYAVRYLAGAYRVAGGSPDRAVSNYARGYYYAAKQQGVSLQSVAQPRRQSAFGLASTDGFAQASRFDADEGTRLSHRHSRHHHERLRMRHRRG